MPSQTDKLARFYKKRAGANKLDWKSAATTPGHPRRAGKDAAAIDLAQHGGVPQPDSVSGLDGRSQGIGITLEYQVAIWAPGLPYPSEALQQRALARQWAESGRNSVLILLAVTGSLYPHSQPQCLTNALEQVLRGIQDINKGQPTAKNPPSRPAPRSAAGRSPSRRRG